MRFIAIDTETENFSPGDQVPRLVCVSVCVEGKEPKLYGHAEGAQLAEELIDDALASSDEDPLILTFQNGFYDLAVFAREIGTAAFVRKVFQLFERDRVWDTMVAEWVLDNADGVLNLQPWKKSKTGYRRPPKGSNWYGLARLASKYLFVEMTGKGEGGIRTNFGWLRGTPIDQWSSEYVDYAKGDARYTVGVALAQWARALADKRAPLKDFSAQLRAYWALHLISAWGLTTNLETVAAYKAELEASMEKMREDLGKILVEVDGEWLPLLWQVKGKRGPVKDEGKWKSSTKALRQLIAAAFERQGMDVPMTDPSPSHPDGQVATDAETIEDCEDPSLAPWKAYKHAEKMLSNYVPVLEQGIVHPRYGITANGRVSHFSPNIGNLPRKGKVRECYEPREGFLLCSTDYGSQELVTFAQVMQWTIGANALADALNQDLDPHMMLAARRMGIDYDDGVRRRKAGDQLVKDHRQKSKGPNFGYPGGMGPDKFVLYMRQQDPPEYYTVEEAEHERKVWFQTWNNDPRRYFRWVSNQVDDSGWIRQFVSGRVRGGGSRGPGVGFTDGANGFFSALAADMSKAATYEVVKRCYTGRKSDGSPSALFGCRVVAMLHDELLAEVPVHRAHECAFEIADVMLEMGKRYCPDVKSKVEPALMRKWFKGAEYVVNEGGILIPWEPKQEGKKAA